MASEGHIPPAEELSVDEERELGSALAAGQPPAAEAVGAGGRLWGAFFRIRDAKGKLGEISVSNVARSAKCARGPLATKGGRFRLLREAIRRAVLAARPPAEPLPAEAIAAAAARREEGVADLRKRLQVSDSLNAGYLARAMEAERRQKVAEKRAGRFLDELNRLDEGCAADLQGIEVEPLEVATAAG